MLALIIMTMGQCPDQRGRRRRRPSRRVVTGAQDAIRLGAIWDFAGPCYMLSESAIQGIKIAVEEINAAGG